jgi:SAM-dependent methyltransferase
MSLDELRALVESVEERRGWDFSRVRDRIDPVPWSWGGVVKRYLTRTQRVLDVGTGGGERFLKLAEYYGSGIGIDTDGQMVRVAKENTPAVLRCRVSFRKMDVHALRFPDGSFDVVLNRHSVVDVDEIARVLRPGGYFITQQVGARNHANITSLFGCGPGGQYQVAADQTIAVWADEFAARGFAVRGQGEYDVAYLYLDAASLMFWMKALPMPEDFDIERHWPQVDHILSTFSTPRGIATNVHRALLIVQKAEY